MAQGKKDPLEGMAIPKSTMFNRTPPTVTPLANVQPEEPEAKTEPPPKTAETPSNVKPSAPRRDWYEISVNRDTWHENLVQRNYRVYQSQDEAIKWLSRELTNPHNKVSESDIVRYLLGGSLALILDHLNASEDLKEKIKNVNEKGIDL